MEVPGRLHHRERASSRHPVGGLQGCRQAYPTAARRVRRQVPSPSARAHRHLTQRAMNSVLPQFLAASQAQQFRAEHSDVQNNPAANRWARGHYDQLVAQGAPESPETVRQAMNAARVQFRLPGAVRLTPTEQDRQQLTGFSASGGKNMEPKNNVVKLGKSEKIMAMSMYGDRFNGDEKKAYAQ